MNQSRITSNKQRGVYSEIINPDNSILYQNTVMEGPHESLYISTQQRQKKPKANPISRHKGIKQETNRETAEEMHRERAANKRKTMEKLERLGARVDEEDEFCLKVEPKVMEPYDPIPGRVPRKVAIDRKKKEYASFDLNKMMFENNIDFASKSR